MIVRGHFGDYRHRHPRAEDVALVAEVADSSIGGDATAKKRIYAAAGIPAYLILDLVNRRLEVHASPLGDSFRQVAVFTSGDEAPVVIDGSLAGHVRVADMLP